MQGSPKSAWLAVRNGSVLPLTIALLASVGASGMAVEPSTNEVSRASDSPELAEVLAPGTWQQVEKAVDRGLEWLATQQEADGSFRSIAAGQPGVTSLAVMAFLSRGHLPGAGPYGERMNRAIDFVLGCQLTNGLFSSVEPQPPHVVWQPSHTASYNHAISGLMLGEVYGQVTGQRARDVKRAIERGLEFTRALQEIRGPKRPTEKGGWRYVYFSTFSDSDLSVTGWQLMFLRSAKNAEFNVPDLWVEEAMSYVRQCWNPGTGAFHYSVYRGLQGYGDTRGMAGAGILALSLGGQHQTPMAHAAGDWLIAHPYRRFGELIGTSDMFFYSTYYCSQAAAQLGGRYWERIFPPLVDVLLSSQIPDGSWPPEVGMRSNMYGQAYSTSMAILSLTPPYQLLPVYQR